LIKIAGFCALPALLLPAQDPAAEALKDLQAALDQPVISIASKRLQRLKEAPADATVLQGEDLRRLGYRTLSEALDGILGFRTVRDRAYDDLAVRGLQLVGDLNTRVLILLDGHCLNSPDTLAGSMVGEDFGIPLERVERIEVIRGPASALYGTTAFAGLVNVVTRAPAAGGEAALELQSRGGLGGWARAGWTLPGSSWDLTATGWQRKGTALDFPELGVGTLPANLDRETRQSAYLRAKGGNWSFNGYALVIGPSLARNPDQIEQWCGFLEKKAGRMEHASCFFRSKALNFAYGASPAPNGRRGLHGRGRGHRQVKPGRSAPISLPRVVSPSAKRGWPSATKIGA
jgi:outer membrane receptor protein involved in Fe transport